MNSQTLQTELYDNLKFFKIIFEAISPKRTLLKDVIIEGGFHLDTVDLQRTHPLLYNRINVAMRDVADRYWQIAADKEIDEIPTLAYQDSKKKKILESIKKASLVVLFICCSFFSFSQRNEAVFSAHAEYSFHYNLPGYGFDAGYHFDHNYVGFDSHLYFTRRRNVPVEMDLKYGYRIGYLQPFITAGFYTCGGEAAHAHEGPQGIAVGAGLDYFFNKLPLRLTAGITGNNIYSSIAIVARL